MQGTTISIQDDLATQLTERFGPLLTQTQLAELLGRTTGGLRYSPPEGAPPPVAMSETPVHTARRWLGLKFGRKKSAE